MEENMIYKKNVVGILLIALIFGITIVGCDLFKTEDTKEIDQKFRGKWEVDTIIRDGVTYTLPSQFYGVQLNTAGWEIGTNSVNMHMNGLVIMQTTNVHSNGDLLLQKHGLSNVLVFSMKISGNTAVITTPDETSHARKVSRFSWE